MLIKLLRNLLSSILSFILIFLKRKPNLWVFSGFSDSYADSPKYFFEYINRHKKEIDAIWITSSDEVYIHLSKAGFPVVRRKSWSGLLLCFRAKVFIYASYPSDINTIASLGAIKVNLWHGYPFKVIERDITFGPLAWIYSRTRLYDRLKSILLHPEKNISPDFMLASSPLEAKRLRSAFGCKNIAVMPSIRSLAANIEYSKTEIKDKKVFRILYAPTWRASNVCNYYKHLNSTIFAINNLIESDLLSCVLEVRLHPAADYNKLEMRNLQHVIVCQLGDINDKTLFYDVLITDFSSILKNFDELDVPYILYSNDLEDYLNIERGLYKEDVDFFLKNMIQDQDIMLKKLACLTNISVSNNRDKDNCTNNIQILDEVFDTVRRISINE